jgi:hypothetical protein
MEGGKERWHSMMLFPRQNSKTSSDSCAKVAEALNNKGGNSVAVE